MTDLAALMSQDHDWLTAVFADFRKSAGGEAWKLFSQFESGLRAHIDKEEQILFPPFEERTGTCASGPTAIMRVEHEQIKQLLQSIRQEIDRGRRRGYMRVPETGRMQAFIVDETDRDAVNKSVKQLADVLHPHHHKEEEIVYLWLQRTSTEAERVVLAERMQSPPPGRDGRS